MKKRILFIERQPSEFVSIENVFRQVANSLSNDEFETVFQQIPFGNSLLGIIKNLLFFKKQLPADIYHITGHIHYLSLRLPRARTVLTIHDLGFLHTRTGFRRYVLKKLFLDWPLRKLRYITTVSQKTKDEIIAYTKCNPDKIHVISNPLSNGFDFSGRPKVFNRENPTILQVGFTNNKNIPKLAEAIKGLPCKLVIAGRADRNLISLLLANGIDYEIKDYLEQSEIIEEYRNADIVAFCSTYEGFGLPIIEAQALGKPVVTSDLSPMKEVSGGAAILVDPKNVGSIREGILKIINNDELREKIIADGLENIKRFSPNVIGELYKSFYSKIIGVLKR